MSLLKKNISKTLCSAVLGLFFALCCVLARLDFFLGLCGSIPLLIGCGAAMSLGIGALLFALYSLLGRFSLLMPEDMPRKMGKSRLLGVFFAAFVPLMVWFALWLLYRFPGCLSPDSTWQLMQARGLEPLSNHHPIAHTMLIRLCINLGLSLSSNPSVALAIYTVVQFTMLALCFSYLIVTMYRLRIRLYFILIILFSFILLPSHAAIGVTMLKDVWFSGFVLLLCATMWRITVLFHESGRVSKWDIGMLLLSSLGMCLFRTNGLYALSSSCPSPWPFFSERAGSPHSCRLWRWLWPF